MNLQERSDKRSLALHRAIVRRLRENPELWAVPLQNIERWTASNGSLSMPQQVWKEILETLPREDVVKLLLSRSQRATHLRSSSPFTGIISQEKRNQIFERYRMHEELIDGVLCKVVGNRFVKGSENNPRRIRDLPPEERESFKAFLHLRCCPFLPGIPEDQQDGYWPADYRSWKQSSGLEGGDIDKINALDRAIGRVKEVMAMDFKAMTPAERLNLCCEVSEIGLKFKAVGHDCELGVLLDALEALRSNLEV